MGQQVFIDTDILIDFGQDHSEAVQTIAESERNYDFCISVIVAMELYTGCRSKKDLANLDAFLSLPAYFWLVLRMYCFGKGGSNNNCLQRK